MQTPRNLRSLAALSFIALTALAASQAHAQATIDQNKALAGNITPGDTAGFPITISQPGSYKLMSNLYVPAGSSGIVITAKNVTLDLNGFVIQGPTVCTQNYSSLEVTCAQGSNNDGIASSADHTTLLNGTVRGFGAAAVKGTSPMMRVEGLHVAESQLGLAVFGDGGFVTKSSATLISTYAFTAPGRSLLTQCVSQGNTIAFSLGGTSLLSESSATGNRDGIDGGSVRGVIAINNASSNFLGSRSLGGNQNGNVVF